MLSGNGITLAAPVTAGTVTLNSTAPVVEKSGVVTATSLSGSSSGGANLTGSNAVSTLTSFSNTTSGSLSLTDSSSLATTRDGELGRQLEPHRHGGEPERCRHGDGGGPAPARGLRQRDAHGHGFGAERRRRGRHHCDLGRQRERHGFGERDGGRECDERFAAGRGGER